MCDECANILLASASPQGLLEELSYLCRWFWRLPSLLPNHGLLSAELDLGFDTKVDMVSFLLMYWAKAQDGIFGVALFIAMCFEKGVYA